MDEAIFNNFKSSTNGHINSGHKASHKARKKQSQSEMLDPDIYKQSIPYYNNKDNTARFNASHHSKKKNQYSVTSPGPMNDFPVRDFYNTPSLYNGSDINLPIHPNINTNSGNNPHNLARPEMDPLSYAKSLNRNSKSGRDRSNKHINENMSAVPDILLNSLALHDQPVPRIETDNAETNNLFNGANNQEPPFQQDSGTNPKSIRGLDANKFNEDLNMKQANLLDHNDVIFLERQKHNIIEPSPLVFDSQSAVNSINSQKILEGKLYSQVLQKPLFITPFFLQDSLGIEKDVFTVNSLMHIFEISLSIAIIAMCGNSLNNDSQVKKGVWIFLLVISVILLIVSLMFLFRVMKFDRNNGIFYCFLATILSIATMWVAVAELLPIPCISVMKSVASSNSMINNFSKRDTYYYLDNSTSGGANLCSLRKAETALISICSMVWFINLIQFGVVFYISRLDFRKGFDEKEIRDTILRNIRGGTSRTDDSNNYFGGFFRNDTNGNNFGADPEKIIYTERNGDYYNGTINYNQPYDNQTFNDDTLRSNIRNFSRGTRGPNENNFYNDFIKIYSDTASEKNAKRYSEKTLVG